MYTTVNKTATEALKTEKKETEKEKGNWEEQVGQCSSTSSQNVDWKSGHFKNGKFYSLKWI
jgi:hypothetical protein